MACTGSFSVETMVSLDYLALKLSLMNMSVAAADQSQMMMASPFAGAGPQAGQPQDYNKLFKAEKDNLAFAEGLYKWVGDGVEDRLLRKYGKLS